MVNVALPKGRLGEKVYDLFEKAGFDCAEMHDKGRKLIFENPEKGIRYFWVKPSDVPIYVERGVADLGILRYFGRCLPLQVQYHILVHLRFAPFSVDLPRNPFLYQEKVDSSSLCCSCGIFGN